MNIVRIKDLGQYGIIHDIAPHELPVNAWTNGRNIRFRDNRAERAPGYRALYAASVETPQFLFHADLITGERVLIYAGATKCAAVTFEAGAIVQTDITHLTPRTGSVNMWTGAALSGVPVFNSAADQKVPMYWNLDLEAKFLDLPNWPALTYCKVIRAYKNILIALNITKNTLGYPYMVKWSSPADPGSLPSSWDETDPTQLAGEFDIAEGQDDIVDGLQMREAFFVYKERSMWRMDFVGAPDVFNLSKVFSENGPIAKNCIAEIHGRHILFGDTDILLHDGQEGQSILDRKSRIWLYQNIDVENRDRCFVFRNPFARETLFAFPQGGSTVCDIALVFNNIDGTTSVRELKSFNHATFGPLWPEFLSTWDTDSDPWDTDLSTWNGQIGPYDRNVPIGASSDGNIYALDVTRAYGSEAAPMIYLERRGLHFDKPEMIKLIRGVRARITGDIGKTVLVKVGGADDPYEEPTYSSETEYVLGSTVANDCLVASRYPAIRFDNGTAYEWTLDSYDVLVEEAGQW